MAYEAEIIYPDGRVDKVPWGKEKGRDQDTAKHRARIALNRAISRGKIKRPSICSRCKRKSTLPIEGHHRDYDKPLDVEWLCKSCHIKDHVQSRRVN